MPICKAKAKSTGERCRRQVTPGRAVCHYHGGKSLAGQSSPSFQHGRRSKYMPDGIAERYAEALSDPELMELKQDVALVETRMGEMLEALDTGESERAWTILVSTAAAFRAATAKGDDQAMTASIATIIETIASGAGVLFVWRDLRGLIQERAALVERERKRMVDAQQMIPLEQVLAFSAAIGDILRDTIEDRPTLIRALDRIGGLVRRGDAVSTDARPAD